MKNKEESSFSTSIVYSCNYIVDGAKGLKGRTDGWIDVIWFGLFFIRFLTMGIYVEHRCRRTTIALSLNKHKQARKNPQQTLCKLKISFKTIWIVQSMDDEYLVPSGSPSLLTSGYVCVSTVVEFRETQSFKS